MINYIGPDGEGDDASMIFFNGTVVASETTKPAQSYSTGDGRIVVGRSYTNRDERYGSVEVDELIFFNAALTGSDVMSICNSA